MSDKGTGCSGCLHVDKWITDPPCCECALLYSGMPQVHYEDKGASECKPRREIASPKKHTHYYKDVSNLDYVDVYRVLSLFGATDPCLQHAIKKLLVPGKRGGVKDMEQDVQEAIDTLERWKEMRKENVI